MMNSADTDPKMKPDENDEVVSMPDVNELTFSDLKQCLSKGISDFISEPLFGLFFGGIFAFIGLNIVLSLFIWDKTWLMYPFIIGFPLIGPFAAVGLYEVSRRLETNQPRRWNEILSVVWKQSSRELRWMSFVMLFIFWIWMYQVRLLTALFLGRMSFTSWQQFFEIITTTSQGWLFIVVGHIVGAFFAMILFCTTVVSFPLLLEREVDFITAMITSFKTVITSPLVMITWGIAVTLLMILSLIPLFLGLLIVLPILGHTTWHIYKRAVV